MSTSRKPLYDRLPEIYKIRDQEQSPPQQLKAFLDILDEVPTAVRDNIEALYHDFFIETCADWVIPYIADLLGTSHLSGDPWTLRADVARTIHHRRRKGTLGAIESLTYSLSGWAAHTVEMRERMAWNQHLNHQRPDEGGKPPVPVMINRDKSISGAVRGGMVNMRDPTQLTFLNGPFDPYAHLTDVKPVKTGAASYNLPNLAIFLWRLKDYTLPVIRPFQRGIVDVTGCPDVGASFSVRFDVHPLGEPMALFNTHRFRADDDPPNLMHIGAAPAPMPQARLSTRYGRDAVTGNQVIVYEPDDYVSLETYVGNAPNAPDSSAPGLNLHLPDAPFSGVIWIFRGADLSDWENHLNPPLGENEIVVDPEHGRLLFGVGGASDAEKAVPLRDGLYVSPTYGFSGSTSGSTGAHPISRDHLMATMTIDYFTGPDGNSAADGAGLVLALDGLPAITAPRIIEIQDSATYELDIEDLRLGNSLHIRAASGQRPIIRLKRPLAFRPNDVGDAVVETMNVTLEGLYITWDHDNLTHFPNSESALIVQASVNELIIDGCTLDPGCHAALDGTRQPLRRALHLDNHYGFTDPAEETTFDQTPQITIRRTICGPIAMDDGYKLELNGSIVDAASGLGEVTPALAVCAASGDAETEWGPILTVDGMTCFGRMRVTSASGQGGIWLHGLEAHDNLTGCIRSSYFASGGNRLPQHQGCVFGNQANLSFVSEVFGQSGYGQLSLRCDRKILEQGPGRDAMGAFGYLLNTHKWKNINIRYREFMPVGIRPVLIPVT
jgi:hypothetical protein